MFEHATVILAERAAGRPVALAVVTSIGGSAPRPVGTSLVVTDDGRVLGSVSGGCVESDVVSRAEQALAGGAPGTEVYGYGDPEGFAVGLACGGTVEVVVTTIDDTTDPAVLSALDSGDRAIAIDLTGSDVGRLRVVEAAAGVSRVDDEHGSRLVAGPDDEADFLIYGGVDVAAPLATLARLAGYRVTVVDARPAFAHPDRFPDAHAVVRSQPVRHLRAQPDRPTTVVCVLTHEDRFDVPALAEALGRRAAFVGAMGSRATTAARERRLREAGVRDADLARLHAPIGLDLGGRSASETALAIMAEVVADRHGRAGGPLRFGTGALHPRAPATTGPLATPGRG